MPSVTASGPTLSGLQRSISLAAERAAAEGLLKPGHRFALLVNGSTEDFKNGQAVIGVAWRDKDAKRWKATLATRAGWRAGVFKPSAEFRFELTL